MYCIIACLDPIRQLGYWFASSFCILLCSENRLLELLPIGSVCLLPVYQVNNLFFSSLDIRGQLAMSSVVRIRTLLEFLFNLALEIGNLPLRCGQL